MTAITSRSAAAPAQVQLRLPNPRRRRAPMSSVGFVVVGSLLALLFLVPILYILFRSFLPASADADGLGWNSLLSLTAANYARIFDPSVGLSTYVTNSLIVAVSTAVLTGVIATLAGYALSRIQFRFSEIVFVLLLGPMVVPYQGLLTPLSLILGKLGLLDSLVGLILVLTTLQLPFSIFVMRNTLDSIPVELEEAAQIDGAKTSAIIRKIMIPLAWPGLVTVCLFGFMTGWNDLLTSVVFLSDQDRYTLPLALTNLSTSFQIPGVQIVDAGLLTATACVATVPVIVLFLSLQRFYTKGLIGGALK